MIKHKSDANRQYFYAKNELKVVHTAANNAQHPSVNERFSIHVLQKYNKLTFLLVAFLFSYKFYAAMLNAWFTEEIFYALLCATISSVKQA